MKLDEQLRTNVIFNSPNPCSFADIHCIEVSELFERLFSSCRTSEIFIQPVLRTAHSEIQGSPKAPWIVED